MSNNEHESRYVWVVAGGDNDGSVYIHGVFSTEDQADKYASDMRSAEVIRTELYTEPMPYKYVYSFSVETNGGEPHIIDRSYWELRSENPTENHPDDWLDVTIAPAFNSTDRKVLVRGYDEGATRARFEEEVAKVRDNPFYVLLFADYLYLRLSSDPEYTVLVRRGFKQPDIVEICEYDDKHKWVRMAETEYVADAELLRKRCMALINFGKEATK
jgi:hypothetical protein